MSGFRGHIAGGVAANGIYVAALATIPNNPLDSTNHILSDWEMLAGLFVIAVLFALWPDVDTNSMGQNIFFGLAFIADILLISTGRLEAAAYLGLLAMTPIVGKHRGWTHTMLAMFLVPLPIVLFPYIHNPQIWTTSCLLYGAAVSGYFSHLLLDGIVFKRLGFKRH